MDRSTVDKVLKLCRIRCTEEEKKTLESDLDKVLDYFELLKEVNTEGIEFSYIFDELTTVLREDEPGETLPRETFMKQAPDHVGGMLKVPPVIKQG